jgi:aerobic-type carbon monoxide dehydrogenase small subunit (CoxS/CutS family)
MKLRGIWMNNNIRFYLNGKPVSLVSSGERMLLWALRSDCGLTGAKYSCGEGFCGACTVLVDNKAVRSCQHPLKDINGKKVLTIEGLQKNGKLHPLQDKFLEKNAVQCGFCTPGMILNAYSLLLENPMPSRKEIIDAMEDNLCRCGGYERIIQAIQAAARAIKGEIPR